MKFQRSLYVIFVCIIISFFIYSCEENEILIPEIEGKPIYKSHDSPLSLKAVQERMNSKSHNYSGDFYSSVYNLDLDWDSSITASDRLSGSELIIVKLNSTVDSTLFDNSAVIFYEVADSIEFKVVSSLGVFKNGLFTGQLLTFNEDLVLDNLMALNNGQIIFGFSDPDLDYFKSMDDEDDENCTRNQFQSIEELFSPNGTGGVKCPKFGKSKFSRFFNGLWNSVQSFFSSVFAVGGNGGTSSLNFSSFSTLFGLSNSYSGVYHNISEHNSGGGGNSHLLENGGLPNDFFTLTNHYSYLEELSPISVDVLSLLEENVDSDNEIAQELAEILPMIVSECISTNSSFLNQYMCTISSSLDFINERDDSGSIALVLKARTLQLMTISNNDFYDYMLGHSEVVNMLWSYLESNDFDQSSASLTTSLVSNLMNGDDISNLRTNGYILLDEESFLSNEKVLCAWREIVSLPNINLFQETIQNFVPQSEGDYNVVVYVMPNLVGRCGRTQNSSDNNNWITISLDANCINDRTILETVKTIYHEFIHAELYRVANGLSDGTLNPEQYEEIWAVNREEQGWQHETMALMYIDGLANALMTIDNNDQFTIEHYRALAWQGLGENPNYPTQSLTQTWNSFSPERKSEILSLREELINGTILNCD